MAALDTTAIGWAVQRLALAAAHAGHQGHGTLGARVERGEPLFTLFGADPARLNEALQRLHPAITITDERVEPPPLLGPVIASVIARS